MDYNKWKIYETKQIREIIRRVAPTAKTILYGSQARNEARSDSDIDLLRDIPKIIKFKATNSLRVS
ncbi:nucleotidyltransferase domain-containing protein, partial [Bacteroides xylanisolvens]|nr:nucleotidyltransferase domain-containing protein [Bacteroides xylanisolvens]